MISQHLRRQAFQAETSHELSGQTSITCRVQPCATTSPMSTLKGLAWRAAQTVLVLTAKQSFGLAVPAFNSVGNQSIDATRSHVSRYMPDAGGWPARTVLHSGRLFAVKHSGDCVSRFCSWHGRQPRQTSCAILDKFVPGTLSILRRSDQWLDASGFSSSLIAVGSCSAPRL